jgi:hypothetical protein
VSKTGVPPDWSECKRDASHGSSCLSDEAVSAYSVVMATKAHSHKAIIMLHLRRDENEDIFGDDIDLQESLSARLTSSRGLCSSPQYLVRYFRL